MLDIYSTDPFYSWYVIVLFVYMLAMIRAVFEALGG